MTASETPKPEPVVIKKYANRRLYNTETSSYVTLEHLSQMIKDGRDFVVRDAKSGDDITRAVLTQIIFEEEAKSGQTLLPVGFLRQLISYYGHGLEAVVPSYLESALEMFARNQERYSEYFEQQLSAANPFVAGKAFAPFEEIARQNLSAFERAARMFAGLADEDASGPQKTSEKPGAENTSGKAASAAKDDRLDALHHQLKAMQDQLDKLSGKTPGKK